jgi:hypothetical protein
MEEKYCLSRVEKVDNNRLNSGEMDPFFNDNNLYPNPN